MKELRLSNSFRLQPANESLLCHSAVQFGNQVYCSNQEAFRQYAHIKSQRGRDFLCSLLLKHNVMNIWRYKRAAVPLYANYLCDKKKKMPLSNKGALRGSSMKIRNVSLMVTELDSTIAFTAYGYCSTQFAFPSPFTAL